MEDLFYFTKSVIALDDVYHIAKKHGYLLEYMELGSGQNLKVSASSKDFSIWWAFGEDYDPFDALPKLKIEQYQQNSSLMITYSMNSLSSLIPLLEKLLTTYGGWIGRDDNMEETYDVKNIRSLTPESSDS